MESLEQRQAKWDAEHTGMAAELNMDRYKYGRPARPSKELDGFYEQAMQTVGKYAEKVNSLITTKEWISCADKLPELQEAVLVYMPKYGTPNIQVCWRLDATNGETWFNVHWKLYQLNEVTHWMKLPELPF